MASGLQLSRDELAAAYRRMRTIRVFEDTVHAEFAAGGHAQPVPLLAGGMKQEEDGEGYRAQADHGDQPFAKDLQ